MTRRGVKQRCSGDACTDLVEGGRWFCAPCWKRLPADLRAGLDAAPPFRRLELARRANRWLVEHRPSASPIGQSPGLFELDALFDKITGSG
jgi:hypothetical protein